MSMHKSEDSAKMMGVARITVVPYVSTPDARSQFAARFEHTVRAMVAPPQSAYNELEVDTGDCGDTEPDPVREQALSELCADLRRAAINFLRSVYRDHPGDTCDKHADVKFTLELSGF